MKKILVILCASALIPLSLPALAENKGPALESVSTEIKASATGHYARARTHIIAAINEFDRGYRLANPDSVIDSRKWRDTALELAQELEKILDPQARDSRAGARYEGDSRLIQDDIK